MENVNDSKVVMFAAAKVRVWEHKCQLEGTYYVLEKKNWLGMWVRPSTMWSWDFSKRSYFTSKEEALKYFEWHKSGKKVEKTLISVG